MWVKTNHFIFAVMHLALPGVESGFDTPLTASIKTVQSCLTGMICIFRQ